ncbi:LITAF domain-containing protein [Caenorhabditis elegans]|uniref:LITAF domain-containing protein n=1 Tax=Caenorhabditis elegans TaxID=6239 RepID=Q9XW97_CAEEL|nr:LITAF domain-containing protein [Caenorhabditis elegans]CAA22069.1 LITAF domain-containing protein [Caenorhabditis elegans]|eukprot:NP_502837.1 Uncharacterized protein CELE_Y40H7A.11 [Caenorhabditis elegans]
MNSENPQIYSAPPPYEVAIGMPKVNRQPAPVLAPPIDPRPCGRVIGVISVKQAPTYSSYQENCTRCQTLVQTRVEHKIGIMWWLCATLSFCFFFCCYLLFFPITKDAQHFCPNCGSLLAVRTRA